MIPQQSPIFFGALLFITPFRETAAAAVSAEQLNTISANALARFEVHDDPPKQLSSPRFPVAAAAAAADVLLLVHDSGVVVLVEGNPRLVARATLHHQSV